MKSEWERAMSEDNCWANVNQTKINNVQGLLLRPAGWTKTDNIKYQSTNEIVTNKDQCSRCKNKQKREYPLVEFWEVQL